MNLSRLRQQPDAHEIAHAMASRKLPPCQTCKAALWNLFDLHILIVGLWESLSGVLAWHHKRHHVPAEQPAMDICTLAAHRIGESSTPATFHLCRDRSSHGNLFAARLFALLLLLSNHW